MICGIFGICDPSTAQHWEQNPMLDFVVSVSENTGEVISGKSEATTKGLKLTQSQYPDRGKVCSFRGSLHKEAHGINYNRFAFDELCNTVDRMRKDYGINPDTTALHSLEIEINLNLKYSPKRIIKAAIAHKKKPFEALNRFAPTLGKVAVYDDHEVKLYDKGRQCGIKGQNILRFGVKVRKMRYLLPFGLSTLSDLTNINKVAPLVSELLKVASEIVFFDFAANTETLSEKQVLKWERFSNPNYWEGLNKHSSYKAKIAYKKLVDLIKATDYNAHLFNWILYEWGQHFTPEKQATFTPVWENMAAHKKATFTHFICTVQRSPELDSGDLKTINQKQGENSPKEKRYCVSCGRDITEQKKGSRFCSEKLHGKQAKKCRNKASGKTRTEKRQRERMQEIEALQKLIKVSPDNLKIVVRLRTAKRSRREYIHIDKLNGWNWQKLRRVISLQAVQGNAPPSELTTKRAKDYIRHLQGFEIFKQIKLIVK